MDDSKAGLVKDLTAYAMYRKRIRARLPNLGDKELEELANALVNEKVPVVKASPADVKKATPRKAPAGKKKSVTPAKATTTKSKTTTATRASTPKGETTTPAKASTPKGKKTSPVKASTPKTTPSKANTPKSKKATPAKNAPAPAKSKSPSSGPRVPVQILTKTGEKLETPDAIKSALASGPKTVREIMLFFKEKGYKLSRKVFDDAQHVRQVLQRQDQLFAVDASDKTQFRYGLTDAQNAKA